MTSVDIRNHWAEAVYSNFDEPDVLGSSRRIAADAEASADELFSSFVRADVDRRMARAKGEPPTAAIAAIASLSGRIRAADPILASIASRMVVCAASLVDQATWLSIVGKSSSVIDLPKVKHELFLEIDQSLPSTHDGREGWLLREARASVATALFNSNVELGCDPENMLSTGELLVQAHDDYLPAYFDRANHARLYSLSQKGSIDPDVVVSLYVKTLERAKQVKHHRQPSNVFMLTTEPSRAAVRTGQLLAERQLKMVEHAAVTDWGSVRQLDGIDRDRFAVSREQ